MAFMLGNHLTFIDSFQFMSSSLDKLVSNLPKDDLIYTFKVFKGKRLNLMSQKAFTHTTSWIALKSSIKWNYLLRISSIASQTVNTLRMMNMTMLGKFGRPLRLRQWVNTMTYTLRVACFCWLMCLKASEKHAYNTTNIGDINYHKENKINGGKQIEFSAESNQFEKKIKSGNK